MSAVSARGARDAETAATGFHDLPRRQLVLTVAGLMMAMFLGALDQTVVGTAMPRVVADLHGFEHYAWVTTAYMLTSTLGVPVFGKLSDIYGRKYFYIAGITSYFTFYVMEKFSLSVKSAQLHLFLFQFAVAAGTLIGGPVGDRVGRKYVIWISILGAAPFTLLLPHAGLEGTTILTLCIGVILSSAFSAILVYAQELLPGSVGLISGLFFGFAFGMGGLGSAALGWLADLTSITYVYQIMAFLPLLGLIAAFLPNLEPRGRSRKAAQT